jgi:YD repeat-containing protein
MMIRNRIVLKTFAVFFLVEIITSTILPSFSWALTAGPSAPEYSSFEPVDTTDMVNLATGELVQNMPVLEVPGPSGGYPLSLSYHAGIKLDQEASWVGLGWTLNPGAINRDVNGSPDDGHGSRREVRDYWAGGESTTKAYTLGLSIPNTGIGASYTLARTQDTFKGFSSSGHAGIHVNPLVMLMSVASGNFGKTGLSKPTFEENKASVEKLDAKNKQDKFSESGEWRSMIIGQSMNMVSGSASIDISISSQGVKSTATLAGQTIGQQNNNKGKISSFTRMTDPGSMPSIGWFNISMKRFYTRYWSDQSDALYAYGSLYAAQNNNNLDGWDNNIESNASEFRSFSNDSYDLPEITPDAELDYSGQHDPSRLLGGSLPAYDRYQVLAQGIGGIIQPYVFENGDIRGQNTYYRNGMGWPVTTHPIMSYASMKKFSTSKKIDFRFKNDFSNSLTVTPSSINKITNASVSQFGTNAQAITVSNSGYDDGGGTKQQLAGSRNVEWFTNEEITNGSATAKGFIDCYANKTDRPISKDIYADYLQPEACLPYKFENGRGKGSGIVKTDRYDGQDPYADIPTLSSVSFQSLKPTVVSLAKKIGGFMVTNESGVTYHYALPVYGYNEYTRTKLKKPLKGAATITENKNNDPYAYTWLLTAITGPDYVDRGPNGPNGILDDNDYGYWVKFDYGLWSDSYQWRTPFTGYMTDNESEYESFSYGIKELYYLDAIETKTHKAFFVKSKRKDGRGVTSRLEGGSNPRKYKMFYRLTDGTQSKMEYSVSPVSTMKLDAIYLFDKTNLKNISITKSRGSKYDDAPISRPHQFNYVGNQFYRVLTYDNNGNPEKTVTVNTQDNIKVKYHNGDLVLDDGDIVDMPAFKTNASKIIEFNTDYSLAKNVDNSIGNYSDSSTECQTTMECSTTDTPFDFEWALDYAGPCENPGDPFKSKPLCCNNIEDRNLFYSNDPLRYYVDLTNSCAAASSLYKGDQIIYFKTGKLTLNELRVLEHGGVSIMPSTKFTYEYNPDYATAHHDEWGYYKSDYSDEDVDVDFIVGSRKLTSGSVANVRAWSLSSIKTPLGAKMNILYEPNDYSTNVYNDNFTYSIQKVELGAASSNQVKIYLKEKLILDRYFSINEQLNIKAFIVGKYGDNQVHSDIYRNEGTNTVVSTSGGYLLVNSPQLFSLLSAGRTYQGNALTPYFVSGFILTNDNRPIKYIGGIRVKSVELDAFDGHKSTTEYQYTQPATNVSSGVTSFKPYYYPGVQYPTDIAFFSSVLSGTGFSAEAEKRKLIRDQTLYLNEVNKVYGDLMLNMRDAPAPGALYKYVTVKNKFDGQELEQYVMHQFETFKPEMISRTVTYSDSFVEGTNRVYKRKHVTLKNNTLEVGNLKKLSVYGKGSLLKTITYGHLNDSEVKPFETTLQGIKQGVVEQSFHKYVVLNDWLSNQLNPSGPPTLISQDHKAVVTKVEEGSNILTSVEEKDYKTGITSVEEYRAFDFYSGQATSVRSTDGYGNVSLSTVVPAYHAYTAMGLKMKGGKNMLTQEAASYVYKVDPSNNDTKTGLASASVQTWSDQIKVNGATNNLQAGIWRKQASYVWKGDDVLPLPADGFYPFGNFQAFNFSNPTSNSTQWQKLGEASLYNTSSHALEAFDMNGTYATTKLYPNNYQVLATAANARHGEIACASLEDPFVLVQSDDPGFQLAINGTRTTSKAHTGKASVSVGQNELAISLYFTPSEGDLNEPTPVTKKKYLVSLWTTAPNIILNYTTLTGTTEPVKNKQTLGNAGEWYLIQGEFDGYVNHQVGVFVSASLMKPANAAAYIDDFRVHPYDAAMISYVYNKWGEVSHILDNNNLFTEYQYDEAGRLVCIFQESFTHGKVKLNQTNYFHHNSPN